MADDGLLTGHDAQDLLRAALAVDGGEMLSWRAVQVDHHRRLAAYRVRVRWPDGQTSEERFGARAGDTLPEGALILGDGTAQVAVWRFPHDPYLPGLAAAYDSAAVVGVWRRYGYGDGPVRLTVRAYRPGRRAVVEAAGPHGRLFLKVVRPHRVADLHRRHRMFTEAGVPSPPSLGYTTNGVLVLQELPGQTLRQALRRGGQPLPAAGDILNLLDRLPGALAEQDPRRSWRDRAPHYANVIAQVMPAEADRVRHLAEVIVDEGGVGPLVPVHGDFYENQLLVHHGRICGLLDIDTAGAGDRLDDLACLLGHLSVLARLDREHETAISRLGARYLATFERAVPPRDLRYRIAAVVLSLATGPHRVQDPQWQDATRYRLELAERWVDSARRMSRLSSSA